MGVARRHRHQTGKAAFDVASTQVPSEADRRRSGCPGLSGLPRTSPTAQRQRPPLRAQVEWYGACLCGGSLRTGRFQTQHHELYRPCPAGRYTGLAPGHFRRCIIPAGFGRTAAGPVQRGGSWNNNSNRVRSANRNNNNGFHLSSPSVPVVLMAGQPGVAPIKVGTSVARMTISRVPERGETFVRIAGHAVRHMAGGYIGSASERVTAI